MKKYLAHLRPMERRLVVGVAVVALRSVVELVVPLRAGSP